MKPPAVFWLNAPAWLPLVLALLHTLWLGTLAAGGLFLALRLVPARHANLRYGLSALALMLVLTLGVGAWALLDRPVATPGKVSLVTAHHVAPPTDRAALNLPAHTPRAGAPPTVSVESSPADASPSLASPPPAGSPDPAAKPWVRWTAMGWLFGVAVCLARAARGAVGAGRLRRRCRELTDPRLLALVEELRTRLRLRRRVRLLVCECIGVPSVMGVFWPAILLPAAMLAGGVPPEQLRAFLAHELAHVRRWDYLVNLGQMLVEALLFFNPFVWWISRQMRLEREACCDQLAAQQCESPALYVEALVAVIQRSRSTAPMPALAASGPARDQRGNALDRARRLLVPDYQPTLRLRWFSLAAVLALSGLSLSGLWLGTRAVAQTIQTPETKAKPTVPPPAASTPQSFTATVSTEDGAPAADDSATAHIYESSGPNSGVNFEFGINQPGLITNHQKGRFTIQPRADYRTLSCAVSMQGYAAIFAGPFAAPFKELENIHFTLRKGYTASVETVDEAGQPIAGAWLEAFYPGPPQVVLGGTKTNASGTAALEHLGEASLNVRVNASGFQTDEIKNVRLDPAKPYRWTLKRGLRTAGIVTDRFHRPIEGATVKLAGVRGALEVTNLGPDGAPLLATADSLGGFALTSLRADCRYFFFVEAPGYSGVYVRDYNPESGGLMVNLGPELMVRGKVLHIPDSAFFLDGVPLFYWQSFMYQDNGFGSAQRSLNLHPKDGEADFSVGPFFTTQTGSLPGSGGPADNGQVTIHIEKFPEIKITVEDLKGIEPLLKIPKFSITYDLAEKTPPVVTPAALRSQLADKPAAIPIKAPASPAAESPDVTSPAPTAPPTPKAESTPTPTSAASEAFRYHGKVSMADGSPLGDQKISVSAYTTNPNVLASPVNEARPDGTFDFLLPAGATSVTLVAVRAGVAVIYERLFTRQELAQMNSIEVELPAGYTATVETVDEAGRPIAGALLSGLYPGPPEISFGMTKTDASGVARFDHLGDDPLSVRVTADGFQMDELSRVHLDRAKPYRWTLKRTTPMYGRITAAATGQPIADAVVKLVGSRGTPNAHLDPKEAPVLATADAQGRFALTTLRPDSRYFLAFEAPGFSGAYIAEVKLASGELNVALGPEVMIRGKLIHAPPELLRSGKLYVQYSQQFDLGDDGMMDAGNGMLTELKNGEAEFTAGPFYRTYNAARGLNNAADAWSKASIGVSVIAADWGPVLYSLNDLPKTDYVIDLAQKPYPASNQIAADSHLAVKPSPAAPTPTPAPSARSHPRASVQRVVMADGSPLGAKQVNAYSTITYGQGGTSGGGMYVDSDGTFYPNVPDGAETATFAASRPGSATAFAGPFTQPNLKDKLDGLEIKLTPGYAAAIQTVDETGKPIIGSLLAGYYSGPPEVDFGEVKTDASGLASLEHIGAAPLNVRVRADGYESDEIANVHLDPATPLRWTLKKSTPFGGGVTAATTGQPIAGAVVKLGGVRGPFNKAHYDPRKAPVLTTTDAQGRFTLGSLRADSRYYLFVEAPGYGGAYLSEVKLAQGELKVALGPELRVQGKIIHAPASVIHMKEKNNLYLNFGQSFRVGENFAGVANDDVTLHPKDGEAEFSVGPFYKVYGEPPDPVGALSSSRKAINLYVDDWGVAYFDADDLPISDFVFDLAEPSSRSRRAEAETPKPSP